MKSIFEIDNDNFVFIFHCIKFRVLKISGPLIIFWLLFCFHCSLFFPLEITGANICLTQVVLVDMLGTNKMANALGIISFFDGFAALIGPPIISKFI